jgi:hypothetical protein
MSTDHLSAKLLANDELFLQPWFLPKAMYLKLKKLLPSSQLAKMRYYFEDYGCLKCGSHEALYGSNGMCSGCSIVIRGRIAICLKKRFRRIGVKVGREPLQRYAKRLSKGANTARYGQQHRKTASPNTRDSHGIPANLREESVLKSESFGSKTR